MEIWNGLIWFYEAHTDLALIIWIACDALALPLIVQVFRLIRRWWRR